MDNYISSQIHNAAGYGSEFESDAEQKKRKKDIQNLLPQKKKGTGGVAKKRELEDEYSKEEGKIQRFQILSMDAFQYARHRKYINDYLLYYGGSTKDFKRDTSKDKNDYDIIRENHRFLWTEEDEDDSWERNLAKKYYDKLFKEYCISDLSRYKENKFGMRWRTEKEVVDGKGQFVCGSKKCTEKEGLRSWEVNFGYVEHGEKKSALVKLRLCPDCSYKLNYHHKFMFVRVVEFGNQLRTLTISALIATFVYTFYEPFCWMFLIRKQECITCNAGKKEILPKKKKKKSHVSETKKHKSDHSSSSDEETDTSSRQESGKGADSRDTGGKPDTEKSAWAGPAKITEDKSREEEFDDYFEDMFL